MVQLVADAARGGRVDDPMERFLLTFTCVASGLALLTAVLQLAFGNPSLRALTALSSLALAGVLGWSAQRLWGLHVAGGGGLPDAVTLWLPLVLSGFVTFWGSFKTRKISSSGFGFECARLSALGAWVAFLPVAFLDLAYV